MSRNALTTVIVCASLVTGSAFSAPQSLVQALTAQELVERGREAFLNRCSGCHGVNGDGNGPAAPMLSPRPRNLVSGAFKLRSTPGGVLPTVSDLLRTLDQGIPGSAMPSFKELPDQEKLALVAYVRALRPEFASTREQQVPVTIPEPPREIFSKKAGLIAAAARGKAIYDKTCIACHGASGAGDGVSAAELKDNDDRPIKAADLRSPRMKSGKTARDLFKALATGLEGSPMPAFTDAFTEAQRWDLVAYVFYLRGREAGIYTEKDELK